jgi:hypothetical protein
MHVSRDGTEDRTAVQQQGNNGDQLQDDLDETESAKGKSVIIVREKAKRGARAVSHHPLHTRARATIDALFLPMAAGAVRFLSKIEKDGTAAN